MVSGIKSSLVWMLLVLFASKGYGTSLDTFPPPGEMVDMGGYRMHLIIEGRDKEGPTVVFFHGAGDIALHWNLILPEVGEFARAVAIDQNGEGWSEHGHGAAIPQQVYDSRQMLKNAGLEPPYILVGHSLGGILAMQFAHAYMKDVAGVVLVDATHPDVVLRVYDPDSGSSNWTKMRLLADSELPEVKTGGLSHPKKTDSFQPGRDFGPQLNAFSPADKCRFQWIYNERPWTYVKGQGNTYEAEVFQEMYAHSDHYHLGDIPLIVLSGGRKADPKGDDNWTTEQLVAHSRALQKEYLNWSDNSRHLIARKSGHQIHLENPSLIVNIIRDLIKVLNKE
jgi:pimeloyl-ACP methyl ester carboxylesterase